MSRLKISDIYQVILALMLLVFCIAPKLIALMIALLFIVTIVGYINKQFKFKFYWPHLFLGLLYIGYLIGSFFTHYPELANGYLENKLSFLIFPILLSLQPSFQLKMNWPIVGLVAGTIIASLIGLTHSVSCYSNGGTLFHCFTSVNFSTIHHPSYFAIFILVGNFGSWYLYNKKEKFFTLKWLIPVTIFSFVTFSLCLSLAGIIFLFLIIAFIVLRWIYLKWNRILFYCFVVSVPILLTLMLNFAPGIKEDFKLTTTAMGKYVKNPEGFVKGKTGYKTGNETRMIMWKVTWDEIKMHPFGVGTGNLDVHLSQRLIHYKQFELAKKDEKQTIRYNPHNQFLQTILEIGWLGGLVLVLFLGSSIALAFKYQNRILQLILFALIFNSLFESILQRQSGIIFFSFWICLLVVFSKQIDSEKNIV